MPLVFDNDGKPIPTQDDVWSVLIRRTDDRRVTVVGPYFGIAGLKRARNDCDHWEKQDPKLRTLICRMMTPMAFDSALGVPDGLYGYSANMWKRRAFMMGVEPPKEE